MDVNLDRSKARFGWRGLTAHIRQISSWKIKEGCFAGTTRRFGGSNHLLQDDSLRECLRIHHEGHEGHKGLRKQGKICVNLCNPWLNLFRVTASTNAQWNFKTLSKGNLATDLDSGLRIIRFQNFFMSFIIG